MEKEKKKLTKSVLSKNISSGPKGSSLPSKKKKRFREIRLYKKLDLVHIAEKVGAIWKEKKTFEHSLEKPESYPLYFYEGPPGTNGKPGIHHVFTRTIKDILCRYKTMRGAFISRKSGWDAHGLPVELAVEQDLGITKDQIGKEVSLESYNKACKKSVVKHQKEWEILTRRIGYWLDLDHPYITCESSYIATVWGLFQRLYEKGLLYRSYSIQPYSPAAGSGLSSHEVNQTGCYKEVKDLSIVAKFRIQHLPNTYFLAWTTTPWTLPANSALAIGYNIKYVCIKTYNRYTHEPIEVILAKDSIDRYFDLKEKGKPLVTQKKKGDSMPWDIIRYYEAEDLVDWKYEQLMPYITPEKPGAFRVIQGSFVSCDTGTGIVHIAPTFGNEDFALAQVFNIPAITVKKDGEEYPIVNEQGRFVSEIKDFAGQYVKSAYASKEEQGDPNFQSVDLKIAIKLKKENKAFLVAPYTHSYPHCWRTDKPIIYYPLKAWFVRTTQYKKRLIFLNKMIRWHPESVGEGRFAQWLENLVDWNVSRSRFWGTPIPIWATEDKKEFKCIGSLEELKKEVVLSVFTGFMKNCLPDDFDLHRPYIDDIILVSSQGKKMYRETEVLDVWFDAGSMFWAQNIDPQKALSIPPQNFPADFISEGIDQTRGWFFTLHVLSSLLYNKIAYKNVLVTGLVLDKKGNKMSKRLGNVIDPSALLDTYGPDVIRWYFTINSYPWENVKFDIEALEEVKRKFFGTLYNTYQFFSLYANLDKFQSKKKNPFMSDLTQLDRWILSSLQNLIKKAKKAYDEYNPTVAARAIQEFVIDDLSNWYVRLNRKRFWKGGYNINKETAYQTLRLCLSTIAQIAAPVAPFYMEQLYQDLQSSKAYDSVHLTRFPKPKSIYLDQKIEEQMNYAKIIASLTHSLRKQHRIKVRIPLSRILIPLTKEVNKDDIKAVLDIITHETNVKKIEFITDTSGIIQKKINPNFYKMGKKYGAQIKKIQECLNEMTQEEIYILEKKGSYTLMPSGIPTLITSEDVTITTQDMSGWATASQDSITLALDIACTPELLQEGLAREIVNRIQQLRKAQNFAIDDKIEFLYATKSKDLEKAITKHSSYIQEEIQALHLKKIKSKTKSFTTLDIDGHSLEVTIKIITS